MFTIISSANDLFLHQFREKEHGNDEWNRTLETHSNKTSQYIDGLNPYTVYLFRVAAENALGYSRPGKESYPTQTHRERKPPLHFMIKSILTSTYFASGMMALMCLHTKLFFLLLPRSKWSSKVYSRTLEHQQH